MTVRGPVDPQEIGLTLMHEHVLVDLMLELRSEGLLNDVPVAVKELQAFKSLGGGTVVDMTNRSLRQHPLALRRISELSGVHIVMGTGFYRHQYLDAPFIDRLSTDALADLMAADLTVGIDGTGICAGIIGEIACDEWLTAQEERIFRAAARAQRRTDTTISTHAARWPIGLAQLDLLEEEGVDLNRVIVGHCDTVSSVDWDTEQGALDYHLAIARRGAYVQFDTIRKGFEYDLELRVRFVQHMIEQGHIRQLLLSHDVAWKSALRIFGGGGYTFILDDFIPRLRSVGITDDQIHTILVDNPRRALTGAVD